MTSPLMIVEPAVEALALVAGMTWLFHTICRTVKTARDHVRLTIAAVAVAVVTALVLQYIRFRLPQGSSRLAIDLGSALLLVVVGIAWLRPAILMSTGIRLPPKLLSLVPPLKRPGPPASATGTRVVRHRCAWPIIGLTGGILVAALNNGDVAMTVSIPVSLALLLVSWWLVIALTGTRAAAANTSLRIIAGVLFAALGSFQASEMLNVDWRHPATVLWALIAGYVATAYWLIETCRGGDARQPLPGRVHPATGSGRLRITASTRTRNMLLTLDICVWTAVIGICLHLGSHAAIGLSDWQLGLLLFVGFILALVHSVLIDVRLPAGG